MYHSSSPVKNATTFAQSGPRYTCRCERRLLETSLDKGFLVKCRRARCSIDCNVNWAYQHATCLARHLAELPGEYKNYRGHLRMPPGSTPPDHAKAKKEFLRILSRWKTANGYTVELHAVLDITSPTEAHWDVTAYSDAPKKPLRAAVSDAWSRAGGLRQSLPPLNDDEIVGQCKYQAKDTVRVDRRRRYIPAASNVLGINHYWYTRDFWRGRSIKSIWAELIEEWFGGDAEDGESSNISNTTLEPKPTPETVYSEIRKQREFRREIERRLTILDDPHTLPDRIFNHLPDTADEAQTVRDVATQWGLGTALARSLLIRMKGAERIPAPFDGPNDWLHDRYWIDSTNFNKENYEYRIKVHGNV